MTRILFLHHSTGNVIFRGRRNKLIDRIFGRSDVHTLFSEYNKKAGTRYRFEERFFPKSYPYGWNNYPYDYYNLWVKHAGTIPYKNEPTLEILTKTYDVIVFKHCFPVANMLEDSLPPDRESDRKTLENYKLQYLSLREKIREFSNTKFIVWTSAAQVEANTDIEQARRTQRFVSWVRDEWSKDVPNIFLWDFYTVEVGTGLYLPTEKAVSESNAHPNTEFAAGAATLFFRRIIDVIENDGKQTTLTGHPVK